MTYTPKRIVAWAEVNERISQSEKADSAEATAIGTHGGKQTSNTIKKLRENL